MTVTSLDELARMVRGTVVGDGSLEIRAAAPLSKAEANEIAFAGDERHLRVLRTARAGACLVPRSLSQSPVLGSVRASVVLVDDALDAFITVLRKFRPAPARSRIGISPDAHIDPTAVVGDECNIFPGAFVGPGAVIGDRCDLFPGACVGARSRIGSDCVLHPNAVLYPEVIVGNRVILHASCVIGADGFGYRLRDGRFDKIPQVGWVEIRDDCEIGACTTIDRGMIGATVVGEGTKLDNLVMIGHNCELGRHNCFASQVGLAGSVTTGDYVRCAGQVGIADHVHLGRACTLGAKAGVHKDIPPNETYFGAPARPEQEELRILMASVKLPDMRRQIRELEAKMDSLTRQMEQLLSTGLET